MSTARIPDGTPQDWRCPEHDSACEFCRKFGCDACDRDIEREAGFHEYRPDP